MGIDNSRVNQCIETGVWSTVWLARPVGRARLCAPAAHGPYTAYTLYPGVETLGSTTQAGDLHCIDVSTSEPGPVSYVMEAAGGGYALVATIHWLEPGSQPASLDTVHVVLHKSGDSVTEVYLLDAMGGRREANVETRQGYSIIAFKVPFQGTHYLVLRLNDGLFVVPVFFRVIAVNQLLRRYLVYAILLASRPRVLVV